MGIIWDPEDPLDEDLYRVAVMANLAVYFLAFCNPDLRVPIGYYTRPTPNFPYWENVQRVCNSIILDSV